MTDIKSMTMEELTHTLREMGQPAFRGGQVFTWLHRGAVSFDAMTNLSKPLREKLDGLYDITAPSVARKQVSKLDGTIKLLYRLPDGNWYPQSEQPENDLLNDYHNAEYAQIFDAKNRSDEWYTP